MFKAAVLLSLVLASVSARASSDPSTSVAANYPDNSPAPKSPHIDAAIVKLADSATDPWALSPPELGDASLARTLLKSGKFPGAVFAVVPKDSYTLLLWVERYDSRRKVDVAHLVGSAILTGPALHLSRYAEKLALFPIEQRTSGGMEDSIPHLVRSAGDATTYVRWRDEHGQAQLFKICGNF